MFSLITATFFCLHRRGSGDYRILSVVRYCLVAHKLTLMKQYLDLLLRLDQFIRQKGTGSPPELAQKMGISERSLYEYLKVLKDLGAPIKFSRQERSYYYETGGQFHVQFS